MEQSPKSSAAQLVPRIGGPRSQVGMIVDRQRKAEGIIPSNCRSLCGDRWMLIKRRLIRFIAISRSGLRIDLEIFELDSSKNISPSVLEIS